MFGFLNRRRGIETRSAQLDLGALYASVFQLGGGAYAFAQSPAILVSSLAVLDNAGALLNESRRLGRTSPLLIAYRHVIESGVLTGEPEGPEFPDTVPEAVAAAVAEMWIDMHDCDRERDLLDRLITDGEFLELADGTIVPPDGFTPIQAGPKWNRVVVGYKIGTSARARMAGLRYVGDRPMGAARALPWVAPALPAASGLLNARTGAGTALGVMSKIASVISNASPDRITASAGVRSGLVDGGAAAEPAGQPIHSAAIGSVPYLKPGEEIKRIQTGPDEAARKYESQLEKDVSSALNMPLSELLSDYSSGSFSNLRMAWADALAEKTRRRRWFVRHYRLPLYLETLSDAFAAGRLPRMNMGTMAALKKPSWPGPKPIPPEPLKQAQTLALLTDKGILDPADAREQLET